MPYARGYVSGDRKYDCDICGYTYRFSQMRKGVSEKQKGHDVCPECFDPKALSDPKLRPTPPMIMKGTEGKDLARGLTTDGVYPDHAAFPGWHMGGKFPGQVEGDQTFFDFLWSSTGSVSSYTLGTCNAVEIRGGYSPYDWATTTAGLHFSSSTTKLRTNVVTFNSDVASEQTHLTVTDAYDQVITTELEITGPSTSALWGDNSADDYTSKTADRLMYELQPDTNQDEAHAGYLGMGKGATATRTNRSVIQFDIKSDLEALGAIAIVSAKLYGYLIWDVVGNHNVSAYRLLQNFVGAEVTWNSFATGSAWNTAGCAAASDAGEDDGSYDRHATALDTIALADGLALGSYAFILDITDLARQWFRGTAEEYGILLQSDNEEILKYVGIENREGPDTQRPYLEVEYFVI